MAEEEQKTKTATSTTNVEIDDDVCLSFLPSPRVEEGLQKVGHREDLMEFVTKVGELKKWLQSGKY